MKEGKINNEKQLKSIHWTVGLNENLNNREHSTNMGIHSKVVMTCQSFSWKAGCLLAMDGFAKSTKKRDQFGTQQKWVRDQS